MMLRCKRAGVARCPISPQLTAAVLRAHRWRALPQLLQRSDAAARRTKLRRHPSLRAENTLEQGGQIEIGIELREMDAKTGWSNLNRREVGRGRVFQPLGDVWRERQFEAVAETYDHAIASAVVACADSGRFARTPFRPSLCRRCKFIALGHGFSSIPRKVTQRSPREPAALQRSLAVGSRSSLAAKLAHRTVQIEDRFLPATEHVNVRRNMISRVDHDPEPLESEDGRHQVKIYLSGWVFKHQRHPPHAPRRGTPPTASRSGGRPCAGKQRLRRRPRPRREPPVRRRPRQSG